MVYVVITHAQFTNQQLTIAIPSILMQIVYMYISEYTKISNFFSNSALPIVILTFNFDKCN